MCICVCVCMCVCVHVCVCVPVCVHVCVCPEAIIITSGMIWTHYDWLNKFLSFYVAAVAVDIISRCGLSIDACHENQSNK